MADGLGLLVAGDREGRASSFFSSLEVEIISRVVT
jgi:hypothetical protein